MAGKSLLDLLGTPGKAKRPAPAAGEKVPTPAKEAKKARVGASSGISRLDAATGKKLQRTVNEKKHKEEERKKAADMLEANAGKFAATEEPDEPSDEAEEVEDETWDVARRLQLALAAWAKPAGGAATDSVVSAGFDAVATGLLGGAARLPFRALAAFFDSSGGPAPTLCGVANLIRQVRHHSQDREADLAAVLTVLLAGKQKLTHCQLRNAIGRAFGIGAAELRQIAPEGLPDAALAARSRQRALFEDKSKCVSAADVAAVLDQHVNLKCRINSVDREAKVFEDRLVKLLAASVAAGRETWHLVRLLQGHMGFSWDVVVRGLAHAVTLSPPLSGTALPTWADENTRAEAMLAMEEYVLQAYAQDGGRTARVAKAVVSGKTGDALVAACLPSCGVPVMPMQAETPKEIDAALQKLGGEGSVFVEWNIVGDRAQVHVREGGKEIIVFSPDLLRRADRLDDATAALAGHLIGVTSCILEVVFSRPDKKKVVAEKEGENKEQDAEMKEEETPTKEKDGKKKEKSPKKKEQDAEKQEEEQQKDKGTQEQEKITRPMILVDLLELNGDSFVQRSLRERRAALANLAAPHARLRLAHGTELAADALDAKTVSELLSEALSMRFLASGEDKAFSRTMGVVLKRLDGPSAAYFAGRRSDAWQALERPPVTGPEADRLLLEEHLSEEEKKHIPSLDEFHFSVISGFRTRTTEGINDIMNIQKKYNDANVHPVWYVDNECPDEYRQLGLKVVKAGKLIPARNHALEDAHKAGKICVQTSDDIGVWCYLRDETRHPTDDEANAACKRCEVLHVSPVAAARFLAAKMRARGPGKCMLGGVYPLSNGGRAMRAEAFHRMHFLLGDFFVAEATPCRFDERLSLKEDYDFTCSHIERHGAVLRCNRMVLDVAHYSNAGGAVSIRNASEEQKNIKILMQKWPKAIRKHPTRENEVMLAWRIGKRASPKAKASASVKKVLKGGKMKAKRK